MDVVQPIILSLKVALLATFLALIIGVPMARLMVWKNFWGKDLVESFIILPMVLPPTVLGFMLLYLFGTNGPIGIFLESLFNIRIVFTWWAAVIASTIIALPLMYQSVKGAFELIDIKLENAARTLGSNEYRVFWTISLPLAWPGILAGTILAFARALGEFGATLMIAGNIPGQTQTMPLAIYFAVESGDYAAGGWLVAIMTFISFAVLFWLNHWNRKKALLIGRR